MVWEKKIGPRGGEGGWKDDFPLDHELPEKLLIDCRELRLPLHPMLAVRLRMFIDWHIEHGRDIEFLRPIDAGAAAVFASMNIITGDVLGDEDDSIVPVTRMTEFLEVEEVAGRTQQIIEYDLTDVAPLGSAAFMAMSELCGNAIDHGRNSLGAYVAVRRTTDPRPIVSIAIGDLGIGVPEHIRQRYPEWREDGWAIAHATEESVTGTGDPHRGIGFSAVMESALTQSLSAAKMDVLSANGFCRLQLVQEKTKTEVFPTSRFRRGTWITYDLVSI